MKIPDIEKHLQDKLEDYQSFDGDADALWGSIMNNMSDTPPPPPPNAGFWTFKNGWLGLLLMIGLFMAGYVYYQSNKATKSTTFSQNLPAQSLPSPKEASEAALNQAVQGASTAKDIDTTEPFTEDNQALISNNEEEENNFVSQSEERANTISKQNKIPNNPKSNKKENNLTSNPSIPLEFGQNRTDVDLSRLKKEGQEIIPKMNEIGRETRQTIAVSDLRGHKWTSLPASPKDEDIRLSLNVPPSRAEYAVSRLPLIAPTVRRTSQVAPRTSDQVENAFIEEEIRRTSDLAPRTIFPVPRLPLITPTVHRTSHLALRTELSQSLSLSPERPNKKQATWMIQASGGMLHHQLNYKPLSDRDTIEVNYAEIRNQTERTLWGWEAGFNVQRIFSSGLSVGLGVHYERQWELFDYDKERFYQEERSVLTSLTINSITGDTINSVYENRLFDLVEKRTVKHYNKADGIKLPLQVGYLHQHRQFTIGLHSSVAFQFWLRQYAKQLELDNSIVLRDESALTYFQRNTIHLQLTPFIGWKHRSGVGLSIEPHISFTMSNRLNIISRLEKKPIVYGIKTGVFYQF